MIYASAFGLIAFCIVLYFLRRDTYKRGKAEAEKEIMEHENEAIANRPITDADLIAKLRNKAVDARKNKRKS